MKNFSKELTIFSSNQLEALYFYLKQTLFAPIYNPSPFTKRIVVVYNAAMKEWLMHRMAKDPDLQVAMGIEFIYLHQIFAYLLAELSIETYLPSTLEITFTIAHAIKKILFTYTQLMPVERADWAPLLSYLECNPMQTQPALSIKIEKRIFSLSRHLAHVFREYGKYGKNLLANWSSVDPQERWQKKLWETLFSSTSTWSYPLCSLQKIKKPSCFFSLHFFSISFLAEAEFDFLRTLTEYVPIFYYLFSPCALFWSDIRSDKETHQLLSFWQKKGAHASYLEQLDHLLRDRNPLLANFGRVGREMAYRIENYPTATHSYYELPVCTQILDDISSFQPDIHYAQTNQPLSLLHALQADLLLMRSVNSKKIYDFAQEKGSIQLHLAPTRRREIEVLYHNLLALLTQNTHLTPSDIIVMAPCIDDYTGYIQSIFGLKSSVLRFQIMDKNMHRHSEIVQGFLQLCALSEGNWEPDQLLQFFNHPCFQRKHSFTPSEYAIMQEWMEQLGIRWGYDVSHRNQLLAKRSCINEMTDSTEIGTWEYGFSQLLLGLATFSSTTPFPLDTLSYKDIEFSEAELAGQWIYLLHSLHADLMPLRDHSQMSMQDWVDYLLCLLDNYLQIDKTDEDALEQYVELKKQLQLLSLSSKNVSTDTFVFPIVKDYLLSLLESQTVAYQEEVSSVVRFCSLMPLRLIPAKVIAFIGMQEGAFPKSVSHSALNLLKKEKYADYAPSSLDYERYLFLEALHLAEEYLLFSYVSYEQKESKELKASLVIEELFSYLDQFYTLQGKKISHCYRFIHPFDAFDKSYFCEHTILNNFSLLDYKLASSFYQTQKTLPYCFIESFKESSSLTPQIESQIDSQTLTKVIKDPLKFHLNRCLSFYVSTAKSMNWGMGKELSLSSLDKYRIKQMALETNIEEMLYHIDREGILPFGLFKTIAIKQIREEVEKIEENMRLHDLQQTDFLELEFCTNCKQPIQTSVSKWVFPAPIVYNKQKKAVAIIGKVQKATTKGLFVMNKGAFCDIWKIWPEFLLYCHAALLYPSLLQPHLIISSLLQPKEAFFSDPLPFLTSLVHYYEKCLQQLSPLFPEWIPFILDEDKQGLKNKIQQFYQGYGYEERYKELRWALSLSHIEDFIPQFLEWKEEAEILCKDLRHYWYPSHARI